MTQAVQRSPWLISARDDLAWLIGSASFAFMAIAAYYLLTDGLGIDAALVGLGLSAVWTLSLDGTHLFATYSRTLLDRQWVREKKTFLWASSAVFVLGPLFVLSSYAALDEPGMRAASIAFQRFALTWAYYHLCRQHWGVTVLYRNKHGDRDVWGRRLDAWLLSAGFAYPYVHASALLTVAMSPAENMYIEPEVWPQLASGLAALGAAALPLAFAAARARAPEFSRCARWIGICALGIAACIGIANQLGLQSSLEWLERGFAAAFVLSAAGAASYALFAPRPINWLKWGMIASALLTHNAILVGLALPPVIALIALTMFHNVQYHRIVRFHNVHRYAVESESDVGWAKRVTDNLRLFSGLSVAYAFFYMLARSVGLTLGSFEMLQYSSSALVWGIAFHHYVIDAVIWRPSRSPRLNADLRIAS